MHFDVFNGDADGIISLLQLRLTKPKESTLITGVKRDISLLKQVDAEKATSVTVLDISMEKNAEALNAIIARNIDIFYVDHHRAGEIPSSSHLTAVVDTDANTCTSLLVNQHLDNKYPLWAVVAAYGDNMTASADQLAGELSLSDKQKNQLKNLGVYINYNGYGRTVEDLHFHPAKLYLELLEYENPFDLIADKNSPYFVLEQGYKADMEKANRAKVLAETTSCKVVELADEPWARRISGVFGNELANASPDKAHAVLTLNADDSYTVSVRAPLNNKVGADEVCTQFPTGGGRAGAAGINALPQQMLGEFIEKLSEYYA